MIFWLTIGVLTMALVIAVVYGLLRLVSNLAIMD